MFVPALPEGGRLFVSRWAVGPCLPPVDRAPAHQLAHKRKRHGIHSTPDR